MNRKERFAREEKRIAEEMESYGGSSSNFQRVDYLPKFNSGEERTLRILPTKGYITWLLEAKDDDEFEDAPLPYAEQWTHFKVGNSSALFRCLSKHNNEPCPVCEKGTELFATKDSDDEEEAKDMKISYQFTFHVAWRGHEDKPYSWSVSPKWANMIIALLANPDYGDLDDPEVGHDIKVKRHGSNLNDTTYTINPRPKFSVLFEGDKGNLDFDKLAKWGKLLPEIGESVKPWLTYDDGVALLGGATLGDVLKARDKKNGTDFNPEELEKEEEEKVAPTRSGRRRG